METTLLIGNSIASVDWFWELLSDVRESKRWSVGNYGPSNKKQLILFERIDCV